MEEEDNLKPAPKPKVVVIMGATGAGKSRLAVDLASSFAIEIINADSMQVYQGLDVLTNKVPLQDQKGVPHHLLGTVSPNVEFTAKDFRDAAIPLINDILSRDHLPVIVGGTNYYIQALVSPLLLDDSVEDTEESCSSDFPGEKTINSELGFGRESFNSSYDYLKYLDPVAANRIHPNDHRKINQYLNLYERCGVLPSKLFQGKVMENWGQVVSYRYNCCFVCVDASLSVLDPYVEQRVDSMVSAGLLNEVLDIYKLNADYTRGLRQAIGVREFEDFLGNLKENDMIDSFHSRMSISEDAKILKENTGEFPNSSDDIKQKLLFEEAVDKVKANTRRLVRRQKRRLNRLQTLFGWNIHYVDSTETLLGISFDSWEKNVVQPCVEIIRNFLEEEDTSLFPDSESSNNGSDGLLIQRDLWTQYICKACGNKMLRGAHEWEQHKQGRGHRKRIYRLRKSEKDFSGRGLVI